MKRSREDGHTPLPPDGGNLRITYRASEIIALGNRRYDEGWDAAIRAAKGDGGLDEERLARAIFNALGTGGYNNGGEIYEDARLLAAEYDRLGHDA